MRDANPQQTDRKRPDATERKASKFDGNPNPEGADSSTLKPKDDTPLKLKKVNGPHHELQYVRA